MYAIKALKQSEMPRIDKKIYCISLNCGKAYDRKEIRTDPIKNIPSIITKMRTTSFLVGYPIKD